MKKEAKYAPKKEETMKTAINTVHPVRGSYLLKIVSNGVNEWFQWVVCQIMPAADRGYEVEIVDDIFPVSNGMFLSDFIHPVKKPNSFIGLSSGVNMGRE